MLYTREKFTALKNSLNKVFASVSQSEMTLVPALERIGKLLRFLESHRYVMTEQDIMEDAFKVSKISSNALIDLTDDMNRYDTSILEELQELRGSLGMLLSKKHNSRQTDAEPQQQPCSELVQVPATTVEGGERDIAQPSSHARPFGSAQSTMFAGGTAATDVIEMVEASNVPEANVVPTASSTLSLPATNPVASTRVDVPMGSISGQHITHEKDNRRQMHITEGAVDAAGSVIVRGLDSRLDELNKISSMLEDMAKGGSAGADSVIRQELTDTLSSMSDLERLLQDLHSGISAPNRVPHDTTEDLDASEGIGTPNLTNGLANRDLNKSPPSHEIELKPTIRPKAKEYYTSAPKPGLEAAITKARAEGKPVGMLESRTPDALTLVGGVSIGVGLAISSLPPGDAVLSGTALVSPGGLQQAKILVETVTTPATVTGNTTLSSGFPGGDVLEKFKSNIPMLNFPNGDGN